MRNAIVSEIMKLQKNKISWIGTMIVALVPFLLILKSLYLDPQRGGYMDWFMTVSMLNTLTFPVISGFVITAIVQREYQEKTLRNILSAPTSKENFAIAKLTVWFLWYLTTLFVAELIVITGFFILFPDEFTSGNLHYTIYLYSQTSIYSFVSLLPVFWITICQKSLFYPSMLVTLGFTALQMAGLQVAEELVLPASICPWTAVSVSGMAGLGTPYWKICTVSIFVCGIVGLIGAFLSLKKQEL